MRKAGTICLILGLLAVLGSCSFMGEYDQSTYLTHFPEDAVNGSNWAPYAKVWVSSTLERADDHENPTSDESQRLLTFAPWYGWSKDALNDRVVNAITPDMPNISKPSVGWSSATKDVPIYIRFDFSAYASAPVVSKVVLYARTDTNATYGNPGANFPQAFEVYTTNNPMVAMDTTRWNESTPRGSFSATSLVKPPLSKPGVEVVFASAVQAKYVMIKITQNTGDFTQLSEIGIFNY
jgi:hypothetical protein